jgi:hypothetical protein
VLYYCTKSYNTTVTTGVHETSEVESLTDIAASSVQSLNVLWNTDYESFYSPGVFCPPGVLNLSMTLRAPHGLDPNESYTVDGCTGLGLSSVMISAIPGVIVQVEDSEGIGGSGELSYPVSRALFGDFLQSKISDPTTRFQNIQSMVSKVAGSLTNL